MMDSAPARASMRWLAVVTSLQLAGCSFVLPSDVEVRNRTKAELRDVVVQIGGNTLRIAAIPSGSHERLAFEVQRDSGIRASYQIAQRVRQCIADAYVTGGWRERAIITIEADGSCRVDQNYGDGWQRSRMFNDGSDRPAARKQGSPG